MADEIMKKLKEHDEQLDTIARAVVDSKGRLDRIERKMENFVTKEDHQEVMNTLDKIVGLVMKSDQEQTFMSAHLKRVEEKTEENTEAIEKINPLVGLEATS